MNFGWEVKCSQYSIGAAPTFSRERQASLSIKLAIQPVSFIGGAIRPVVPADAGDLVVPELTLVGGAISPLEVTILSMQETVFHFTAIGVAISELASALTMVNLANL